MATLGRFARAVTAGERVPAPELGNNEIGDLGRALASMREQPDGKQYVEQYVQTLAHEMKSPIAAIRAAGEILEQAPPNPERGRFLPRSQRIGADGFQAQWDISSLAAGSQAQYLQEDDKAWLDSLQLGLVEPVNIYSQADRASKYGILTTRWCWAR